MRIFRNILLVMLLFVWLSLPVLADDGRGQVVFPGGSLVLESGDVLRDDVVVLGGSLDVHEGGRVAGGVTLMGGSSSVDGQIDGNLVMIGGNLDLGPHATVDGDLVSLGGTTLKSAEATVRGQTIEGLRGRFPEIELRRLLPPAVDWADPRSWAKGSSTGWFRQLIQVLVSTMGMMALGLLLVSLLPRPTSLIVKTVEQSPAASIGVGVLTLMVLSVVLVLLVVICIGIPVAILLVIAAMAAGVYGWVAVGSALGRRLLVVLKSPAGPALDAIVGVGSLSLFSAVPCLGWFLGLIAVPLGFGAVVLTRFGTLQYVQGRQGLSGNLPANDLTSAGAAPPSSPARAEATRPDGSGPSAPRENPAAVDRPGGEQP